ncbi:hypothetical protein LguiA_029203 [Lonicera macranthoides]
MEYNKMEPRMCKWKAQQCTSNQTSATIALRERIDDLVKIDVCWDPYKDHRDVHPFVEVAYYCGLVVCFDIAEPYHPKRVLRHFGRVQTIPTVPIIPTVKSKRRKTSNAYKITHPQVQPNSIRSRTRRDHGSFLHGDTCVAQKAAIVKAMSLLEGALFGQEDKDLNVVCF